MVVKVLLSPLCLAGATNVWPAGDVPVQLAQSLKGWARPRMWYLWLQQGSYPAWGSALPPHWDDTFGVERPR